MPTSPIDTTIAFLYAQTGHAARLAHETAVAPQAGAAMARLLANEMVREEEKKVPTAEKGDKSRVATDKDKEGGQRHPGGRRRQARRAHETPPEEEQEDADNGGGFLSGNLLNIKV